MRKVLIGTVVMGLAALSYAKDDKGAKAPPPTAPGGGGAGAAAKPAAPKPEAPGEMATAELKNAKGEKVGEATFEQTPHGVLVTAEITNLPAGMHAFHIHETGKCEPPFKTAGGHFNPAGKKHGVKSAEGCHGGDLPNISVGADGKAKVQFVAGDVTLKAGEKNSLLDADGSALVLHAGADDYKSDPAGNAGDRIACGVVTKK
jgi:Cu-Zn family superoxide dismutase